MGILTRQKASATFLMSALPVDEDDFLPVMPPPPPLPQHRRKHQDLRTETGSDFDGNTPTLPVITSRRSSRKSIADIGSRNNSRRRPSTDGNSASATPPPQSLQEAPTPEQLFLALANAARRNSPPTITALGNNSDPNFASLPRGSSPAQAHENMEGTLPGTPESTSETGVLPHNPHAPESTVHAPAHPIILPAVSVLSSAASSRRGSGATATPTISTDVISYSAFSTFVPTVTPTSAEPPSPKSPPGRRPSSSSHREHDRHDRHDRHDQHHRSSARSRDVSPTLLKPKPKKKPQKKPKAGASWRATMFMSGIESYGQSLQEQEDERERAALKEARKAAKQVKRLAEAEMGATQQQQQLQLQLREHEQQPNVPKDTAPAREIAVPIPVLEKLPGHPQAVAPTPARVSPPFPAPAAPAQGQFDAQQNIQNLFTPTQPAGPYFPRPAPPPTQQTLKQQQQQQLELEWTRLKHKSSLPQMPVMMTRQYSEPVPRLHATVFEADPGAMPPPAFAKQPVARKQSYPFPHQSWQQQPEQSEQPHRHQAHPYPSQPQQAHAPFQQQPPPPQPPGQPHSSSSFAPQPAQWQAPPLMDSRARAATPATFAAPSFAPPPPPQQGHLHQQQHSHQQQPYHHPAAATVAVDPQYFHPANSQQRSAAPPQFPAHHPQQQQQQHPPLAPQPYLHQHPISPPPFHAEDPASAALRARLEFHHHQQQQQEQPQDPQRLQWQYQVQQQQQQQAMPQFYQQRPSAWPAVGGGGGVGAEFPAQSAKRGSQEGKKFTVKLWK